VGCPASTPLDRNFLRAHAGACLEPLKRSLIDLIWDRRIDPGKVFDLELPLDEAAEAYAAMDQRRAVKVLLRP
jgi:threonine dehydrogenase-like Zn-dependent dehydrogenase